MTHCIHTCIHTYIKNVLSTKVHKDRGKFEAQTIAKRAQKYHMCVCTCVCVCGYGIYRSKEKNALQKKIQSSLQTFYPEGVTPRWGGVASL